MSRSRRGRTVVLVLGVVAVAAVVGWRTVSTGGDAPIADGFEVVDGSELIGMAMPLGVMHAIHGEPVLDDGFQAILVVRGHPIEVMNRYIDQARELGLTDVGPSGEDEGASPSGTTAVPCGDRGDRTDDVYTCAMSARTPTKVEPRSVVLSFARGVATTHSNKK